MKMKPIALSKLHKLLPTMPLKYRALAYIGVTTGCRITEILKLKRSDLLTPEGKFKEDIKFLKLKANKKQKELTRSRQGKFAPAIPEKHRKKVQSRTMAIPAYCRPVILKWLRHQEDLGYCRPDDYVFRGKNGNPLSRLRAYRFFTEFFGCGHGTHWMRKTFARTMYDRLRKTRDELSALRSVQKALGHARLDTTIRYLELEESELRTVQDNAFRTLTGGKK